MTADEPVTGTATPVEAFEDFYRLEYGPVVALAYGLTGDRGAAEDLAQDAFSDAYRSWDRLGRYDIPGAWVRRAVINRSRSRVRHLAAETRALVRLRRPEPSAQLELSESADRFWRAVRALPKRQAQCVALRYADDLSVEAIAGVVGCAPATVRVHLHRGRRALAGALGLELGEDSL